MVFSWLKTRRRRKLLARPFPAPWLEMLERNLPAYLRLTREEQAKLRDDLRVFVAEKNWEGCGGLEMTDEIRVTIAAQAALMALALPGDPWTGVLSILVYASAYSVPVERWHEGFSLAGHEERSGEAWYRGPVILSWADVKRDTRSSGRGSNVVWHEFAHQLDMLDHSTNGTPPLASDGQRRQWHEVMTESYEQLIDDSESGKATLLDDYGAESEAEFFAVASECFFDCPVELEHEHPKLYALLREYYGQDPAKRITKL